MAKHLPKALLQADAIHRKGRSVGRELVIGEFSKHLITCFTTLQAQTFISSSASSNKILCRHQRNSLRCATNTSHLPDLLSHLPCYGVSVCLYTLLSCLVVGRPPIFTDSRHYGCGSFNPSGNGSCTVRFFTILCRI